jgi:hypothetical protein
MQNEFYRKFINVSNYTNRNETTQNIITTDKNAAVVKSHSIEFNNNNDINVTSSSVLCNSNGTTFSFSNETLHFDLNHKNTYNNATAIAKNNLSKTSILLNKIQKYNIRLLKYAKKKTTGYQFSVGCNSNFEDLKSLALSSSTTIDIQPVQLLSLSSALYNRSKMFHINYK